MGTDRRTDMMKLIVAFHNFMNAPKNTIDITGNYTPPVELGMIDGFRQEETGKSLDPELTHQKVARLF